MKNRILLELRTAVNPPQCISKYVVQGDERLQQYVDGFKCFFSLFEKKRLEYNNLDIILVDNTVYSETGIHPRIWELVPDYVDCYFLGDSNEYGKIDKGLGCMETWKNKTISKLMKKYKWHLFFEPKQELLKFDFIGSFMEDPRNLFIVQQHQFYTGLFGIDRKTFTKYINSFDLDDGWPPKTTLESHMKEYFKSNNLKFGHHKGNIIYKSYYNTRVEF